MGNNGSKKPDEKPDSHSIGAFANKEDKNPDKHDLGAFANKEDTDPKNARQVSVGEEINKAIAAIEEKHKNDPENEYKNEVLPILEEIKEADIEAEKEHKNENEEQKQKIFDKVIAMLGKLNADQVKLLAKLSENELHWLVGQRLKTYNETLSAQPGASDQKQEKEDSLSSQSDHDIYAPAKPGKETKGASGQNIGNNNNNNNNNNKKGESSHGSLPSLSENQARRTNYGEYINGNYYSSDYNDTNSQLMFANNGHNQQGLYNAHVYSMNTIGYEPYGVGLMAIILLCCITPIRYLCGVVSGVIGSYIFKLGNNKLKKSNDNKHEYEQISDHDGVV